MLGCVRLNGSVATEHTDIGSADELPGVGSEMTNGNEGAVRSNPGGAGSTSVARACMVTLSDSVEILKDWRVISSDSDGKGTLCPG